MDNQDNHETAVHQKDRHVLVTDTNINQKFQGHFTSQYETEYINEMLVPFP